MRKSDIIFLPDVRFDKLINSVNRLVNKMQIDKVCILKAAKSEEFILTFPRKIGNKDFIDFFCRLMEKDFAASKRLTGWFLGNNEITKNSKSGSYSNNYSNTEFSKLILLTHYRENNGSIHQFGVIEDGRGIHFSLDGTYKIIDDRNLDYYEPRFDPDEFELVYTAVNEKKQAAVEKSNGESGFLSKIKKMFG